MLPAVPLRARKCIATLVSSGYENLLDDMLGSLYANGNCQDALLVVFLIDGSEECERIAKKYNASIIRCRAHSRINAMSKALLYSVAKIVNAEQFLCLDADMLVLNDLSPVFSMIEACPPGKILACYEGNAYGFHNLDHAFRTVYGGVNAEKNRLQITSKEDSYPLVVNDGLFAGGRNAMLALDDVIRDMANAPAWADGNKNIWWRNQYIFNLALARLDCGVELDASYNIQLHSQDVTLSEEGARIQADWHGRLARVLHFNGIAKQKYPEWQGRYAKVLEPMVGRGGGDGYAVFLEAIRNWVGLHGMKGLAWSFYGLTDGTNGKVNDPSVLPLFANLYYLIRANGCVRVLETGTARGVSAACLATAVGHRQGGCVVTIDPYDHPGRQQLWMTLPETYRNCIQPRLVDSFTGMQSAIDQGERYDAVLLDSVHTEEHVWTEFQLALQLVCRGGLIIIHDALYANGTVDAALRRIQTAGYNVVRLLSAECGVAEDDHLGLAVIENRLRETAIK
jgi:predicted O-methyltransferase YrrM